MANEQEREKLIDSCNPKIEKRSGGRPMSDDLVERLRRRARAEESGGTCDLQMEDVGALLREAISAIEAKGKALAECRLAISGELNLADAMQVKLLEAREAERAAGKLALAAEQEIARLRATLAAVEAERDAAQRQIDILGEENGAVHRRNEALAARLKEAEEALAEGIDVLNNLSSSIQVHGNYSSESTLTFLGQAIAACEDAAAALRPTDDRREPGTGGGDE